MLESKPVNIGGQAVIEGVMMRSPKGVALAVRRPDGSVYQWREVLKPLTERFAPLKYPMLRGVAVLAETLFLGIKTLNLSAAVALEEEEKGMSSWEFALTVLFAFALGIALFVAAPHWLTGLLGRIAPFRLKPDTFLFHLIDGVFRVLFFVLYLKFISIPKDMRRVLMYHGAEHKAVTAFEAGAKLDVDEVMNYPRFHARCGTSFILVVIIVAVLAHAVTFSLISALKTQGLVVAVLFKVGLIFPIAGIAYELIKLSHRFHKNPLARAIAFPGVLLQRLTTKEPDQNQVEVAIIALKAALAD